MLTKLFLILFIPLSCLANETEEATKNAILATVKYTKTDERLEQYYKDITSKNQRKALENFGSVTSMILNKRVEVKWEW